MAVAAAAAFYAVHTLTFVTSPLRLLPQNERYVVLLKEYLRDFGELNDIVVAVESPSPERSKAYAARLVSALRDGGGRPPAITYRVDPAYFEQRGLLYLSVDDADPAARPPVRLPGIHRELRGPPHAGPAPRGPQPADRQCHGRWASSISDWAAGERKICGFSSR